MIALAHLLVIGLGLWLARKWCRRCKKRHCRGLLRMRDDIIRAMDSMDKASSKGIRG